MPNAIESGLKHGISEAKIKALADDWGVDLEEAAFVPDDGFSRAIYDMKRNRVSAYSCAYYVSLLMDGSDEAQAKVEALMNIADDGGVEFNRVFVSVGWRTIERDKLPGAQIWLDRTVDAATKDIEAFEHLGTWVRKVLDRAEGEKDYNYLAVRLLLSLPEKVRLDYPKAIQSALNRVKHYGYLAGCWRIEKDAKGKSKTIYHASKIILDL